MSTCIACALTGKTCTWHRGHAAGYLAALADLRTELAPLLVQVAALEGPSIMRETVQAFLEMIARVEGRG